MNSTVFSVPETSSVRPNTMSRIRNTAVAAKPESTMPFGIQFL